jgi:hypothetical protein
MMAKRGRKPKGDAMERRKTTVVLTDELLQALKHAAIEEHSDVSAILARLAEHYLATRRKAVR